MGNLCPGRAAVLPGDQGAAGDAGNISLLDHNGDDGVDLADAVSLLIYMFQQGAEPVGGMNCRAIPGCPDSCLR